MTLPQRSSPVITGYYRYTDIMFDWHKSMPDIDDLRPLRALLDHNALVSPDHPLHRDGVNGIELYIGTLSNGDQRLLFSSKQIGYIRYWLHAMGLTPNPIPLPYSDCLLTGSDIKNVVTVIYRTAKELRDGNKGVEKNSKRLKNSQLPPMLTTRRELFERVRNLWAEKVGTWCAIDFEAWERDYTMLIEAGWSIIRWKDGLEINEKAHLAVSDFKSCRNSYFMKADYKENYNFGETQWVDKAMFKQCFHDLFNTFADQGPLFIVVHGGKQDITYLTDKRYVGVLRERTDLTYDIPEHIPQTGIFIVDTGDLFAALEGQSSANIRSLESMTRHLLIPTQFLHNAGNDAHYTMLALKTMALGDPVDTQREKRWPRHTVSANSVEVKFQKWEEDSDCDDEYFPMAQDTTAFTD